MYRLLSDLRILRLALHMEETFERYEESLRNAITEVPVRARLAPLFDEGTAHARLRKAFADLSKEASALEATANPQDVLQTLWECEQAAHEFYVYYLDRLSDPKLVELFKGLAKEEAQHGQAVEAAMDILRHLPRPAHAAGSPA